jgi:drug/metabolite transporter (DMT)-like permease
MVRTRLTNSAAKPGNEENSLLSFAVLIGINTLIAGLTPIGARMATAELPPFFIGWVRFGAAGFCLLVAAKAMGRRYRFGWKHLLPLLGISAICVPLNQAGFLYGVKHANASHASLFYALTPLLVFWGLLLLGRTQFRWIMLVATVVSFAGAASAMMPKLMAAETSAMFLRGDLLLFSAVCTWTLFTILSKPYVIEFGPLVTLSVVFLLGAVLQTPLMLLDLDALLNSTVTWGGLSGLVFITLITSFANYLLWYVVIARYDIAKAAVVVNSSILITIAVEYLMFDEPMTWWLPPAAGLTLLGIWLATRPVAVAESHRLSR